MSADDVSFTLVGSIVWTISCVTVPASDTGIPADSVTCEPGATVALLLVKVTAPPVASATSIGMLNEAVNIPMAINTRPSTPCRRLTSRK